MLDRLPCRALAPLKVDELVEIADPGETSILLVPGQPGYGAMRQISQRMARCRQLPVKQRDDARFGLVEHKIADAIVAMHQAGSIVGGNVPGPRTSNYGPSVRSVRSVPSDPFQHRMLKTVCENDEKVSCKFYMIRDIESGEVWRITMRNAMSPADHFLV